MGAAFLYSNMCDFASCEFQSVSNCQMYFPKFQFKKYKEGSLCKQHVCLESAKDWCSHFPKVDIS